MDYTNRVITLWYRPPELLLGSTAYGTEIDMWSSGCIMAEMLLKKPIFPGNDEISQLDHIWKVCGTPTEESWPGIETMPWWSMMRPKQMSARCLREMMKRFAFWICVTYLGFIRLIVGEGFKLLDSLLQMDPGRRPSALDALNHSYFSDEHPRPCLPSELPKVEGDWHEYESKQRKRGKPVGEEFAAAESFPVTIASRGDAEAVVRQDSPSLKASYIRTADSQGRGGPPGSNNRGRDFLGHGMPVTGGGTQDYLMHPEYHAAGYDPKRDSAEQYQFYGNPRDRPISQIVFTFTVAFSKSASIRFSFLLICFALFLSFRFFIKPVGVEVYVQVPSPPEATKQKAVCEHLFNFKLGRTEAEVASRPTQSARDDSLGPPVPESTYSYHERVEEGRPDHDVPRDRLVDGRRYYGVPGRGPPPSARGSVSAVRPQDRRSQEEDQQAFVRQVSVEKDRLFERRMSEDIEMGYLHSSATRLLGEALPYRRMIEHVESTKALTDGLKSPRQLLPSSAKEVRHAQFVGANESNLRAVDVERSPGKKRKYSDLNTEDLDAHRLTVANESAVTERDKLMSAESPIEEDVDEELECGDAPILPIPQYIEPQLAAAVPSELPALPTVYLDPTALPAAVAEGIIRSCGVETSGVIDGPTASSTPKKQRRGRAPKKVIQPAKKPVKASTEGTVGGAPIPLEPIEPPEELASMETPFEPRLISANLAEAPAPMAQNSPKVAETPLKVPKKIGRPRKPSIKTVDAIPAHPMAESSAANAVTQATGAGLGSSKKRRSEEPRDLEAFFGDGFGLRRSTRTRPSRSSQDYMEDDAFNALVTLSDHPTGVLAESMSASTEAPAKKGRGRKKSMPHAIADENGAKPPPLHSVEEEASLSRKLIDVDAAAGVEVTQKLPETSMFPSPSIGMLSSGIAVKSRPGDQEEIAPEGIVEAPHRLPKEEVLVQVSQAAELIQPVLAEEVEVTTSVELPLGKGSEGGPVEHLQQGAEESVGGVEDVADNEDKNVQRVDATSVEDDEMMVSPLTPSPPPDEMFDSVPITGGVVRDIAVDSHEENESYKVNVRGPTLAGLTQPPRTPDRRVMVDHANYTKSVY
ncbi:kinase subunit of RNA polymerase II carboxy-terminal domain kinase I [Dinochytrium kinnereticum]|nr:kinase subunit of RNA polymerase II carboxy-terminal domain kinase I [Dinochytrium kinnereticum]